MGNPMYYTQKLPEVCDSLLVAVQAFVRNYKQTQTSTNPNEVKRGNSFTPAARKFVADAYEKLRRHAHGAIVENLRATGEMAKYQDALDYARLQKATATGVRDINGRMLCIGDNVTGVLYHDGHSGYVSGIAEMHCRQLVLSFPEKRWTVKYAVPVNKIPFADIENEFKITNPD